MYVRRLLTLINFALFAFAIIIYIFAPVWATDFLYIFIVWMFVSLIFLYLPISRRQIGASAAPPRPAAPPTPLAGAPASAASAGSAPLPSAGAAAPIGFCIYCGTNLPPGAGFCPACGRAIRRM